MAKLSFVYINARSPILAVKLHAALEIGGTVPAGCIWYNVNFGSVFFVFLYVYCNGNRTKMNITPNGEFKTWRVTFFKSVLPLRNYAMEFRFTGNNGISSADAWRLPVYGTFGKMPRSKFKVTFKTLCPRCDFLKQRSSMNRHFRKSSLDVILRSMSMPRSFCFKINMCPTFLLKLRKDQPLKEIKVMDVR